MGSQLRRKTHESIADIDKMMAKYPVKVSRWNLLIKNRIEFDERYLALGTLSPAVRALG